MIVVALYRAASTTQKAVPLADRDLQFILDWKILETNGSQKCKYGFPWHTVQKKRSMDNGIVLEKQWQN